MKKIIISLIMMVCMLTIVSASEIYCEDQLYTGESCLLVTPILSCNTYDIINGTLNTVGGGDLILNDVNLTVLNGNIYYLNFSQPIGEYTVRLCDDVTSREIRVVEKSKMAWTSIILSLAAMTVVLAGLGYSIRNKHLAEMKLLFFIWATVNGFALGFMPLVIALNPSDSSKFLPVAIGYLSINAIGIIAFIFLFSKFLIFRAMEEREDEFN